MPRYRVRGGYTMALSVFVDEIIEADSRRDAHDKAGEVAEENINSGLAEGEWDEGPYISQLDEE